MAPRTSRASAAAVCGLLGMMPAVFAGGDEGAAAPPTSSQIYAAYVLLAEAPPGTTVALARVIVDPGAECPALVPASGATLATTPRDNPQGFAVTVCEALYPFGTAYTVQGGPSLPAVSRNPAKVVVVGDTGCKPKDQAGCSLDDPEWPFPQLMAAAAIDPPDLVIHVGDYNYRGTPSSFTDAAGKKTYYYDAGDGAEPSELCELPGPYYSQNSTGNPDADAWQAWWLDFFQPAAPLLNKAPWVFARGNHELCSHAGPGWFYFLDASSNLAGTQLACPSQDGEGPALPHLQLAPPQVLTLDSLELLVIDSANACDQLPGLAAAYQQQFQAATPRLQTYDAWLISHRPIWGFDGTGETLYDCDGNPVPGNPPALGQLNQSLQCALAGVTGQALLPKIDHVLVGHMHRFEALAFAAPSQNPPTLVVGNSGVAEDTGPPTGAFSQTIDGGSASGFSVISFGYFELSAGPAGWQGAVVAVQPSDWSAFVPACTGAGQTLCVKPLPASP